jgi:membrane protease YdiL (CAAX protease family)
MLFSIKKRLVPTLLLLAAMAAVSFLIRALLALPWDLAPRPGLARDFAVGLGAVVASDGLVHSTLWLLFGDRYLTRYQSLADYFRPQGLKEIAGAGLLAGGEELFFRGVLLGGFMSRAGLGTVPALVLSSLAFGALHRLPDRRLAPFALWAIWEGILLGGVYLAFGSLLVSVLVHAAHDLIGFSLFAWQRHTGQSLDQSRNRQENTGGKKE